MFIPILANTRAEFMINNASDISQDVSDSWDAMWDIALSGRLYSVLADAGVVVAVICICFWILNFARQWLNDEGGNWVLSELAFPALVILLLSNNGANLAMLSRGLRDTISHYNAQILEAVATEINFEARLSQLADYSSAINQMTALRSQCNSIIDPAKLQECIELQTQSAEELLNYYEQTYPEERSWIDDLADRFAVNQVDPTKPFESVFNVALSFTALPVVEAFLIAMQAAFQQLVEASMLLTALIAPIAVGATLLPFGAKPFYAWITGFFSLGMCKLCFNILTGLVAATVASTGPTDTLPTAIVIGFLSPVLAFALATGGGMAIFNGIVAASSSVVGFVAPGASSVANSIASGISGSRSS